MITPESISKVSQIFIDRDKSPAVTAARHEVDLEAMEEIEPTLEEALDSGASLIGLYVSAVMTGMELQRIKTEKAMRERYEGYWND